MKAWGNYWVDVVIALSFVVAGVSGVILWPLLGLVATRDYVLGLHILTWSTVHTWGGIIMTLGVLAHLVLHWRWMVNMTRRAWRTARAR
jgi:hypothetical protein